MDAVMGDPRRHEVQAGEPAEPTVGARSVERLRRDGSQELETLRAARAKRPQGLVEARLAITPLFGPALRLDAHEVARAAQDHAKAGAKVLALLVTKMADDFHRRPLGEGGTRACALGVETAEDAVEHGRHLPELTAGIREEGGVHALIP